MLATATAAVVVADEEAEEVLGVAVGRLAVAIGVWISVTEAGNVEGGGLSEQVGVSVGAGPPAKRLERRLDA